MNRFLDDLEFILSQNTENVREVYDRAAPQYDRFREIWLKLAGAEAEQATLDSLARVLEAGQRALDAGCGTGAISREMLDLEPALRLTLLDQSLPMLERARDVPGDRVRGSVLALPFASDQFDVVVSGWVIETVPEPAAAVAEYLRVLSPMGYLFYTFCSLPEGWLSRLLSIA